MSRHKDLLGAKCDVFKRALERWRLFWSLEPGHRFQTHYHNHRRRRRQGETPTWVRQLNLLGGPALIIAGFAFLLTPGPSYIIIVIGLWMLAGEILFLARFFDRAEVRLRRLGGWIKRQWSSWPTAIKVLAVSICVVVLVLGAYSILFGS